MKRILSILLILILTFSTVGEAFAADIADTASSEEVVSDETLPDDFEYEDPLPPEAQMATKSSINIQIAASGLDIQQKTVLRLSRVHLTSIGNTASSTST